MGIDRDSNRRDNIMTKIGISFSGGIDSTVLLHKTLTESTDPVTAIFLGETYLLPPEQVEEERRRATKIVEWLKENTRDFRFIDGQIVISDPSGVQYLRSEKAPIRAGFTQEQTIYWYKSRMASLAQNAITAGVDEVREGFTVWNTRHDDAWRKVSIREYTRRTMIPLNTPWRWKDTASGLLDGRSSLLNHRDLPAALKPLVIRCNAYDPETGDPCGNCEKCSAWAFYEAICDGLTEEQLATVEARLQKVGAYGAFWNDADPVDYRIHDVTLSIRDNLDEWRSWAKIEGLTRD